MRASETYKIFEGKRILIITKSGLHYNTNNLKCNEDYINFTDRFGMQILLDISEINSVEELRNG